MEFSYIQGFHGSTLLYIHEEKHLFMKTNDRNGRTEYICYEVALSKEKYRYEEPKIKCNARASTKQNMCKRNKVEHQQHANHELVFRDLQTLNAIKEKCRLLSEWCPSSAHKISAKEIFMIELAK